MLVYTPSPIPSSGGKVTIKTINTDYKISRIESYPTNLTFISKSNYSVVFSALNNTGSEKTYSVYITLIDNSGDLVTEEVELTQQSYSSSTDKVTLTLNTDLDDCSYTFFYNDTIYTTSNSITVDSGSSVDYTVSKTGYYSVSDTVVVNSDTTLTITLTKVTAEIEVDTDITKVPAKGKTFKFYCEDSTSFICFIPQTVTWLTTTSYDSSSATITADSNSYDTARSCTVRCTVTVSGTTFTKSFTITQLSNVVIDPPAKRIDCSKQTITVVVNNQNVELDEYPNWVTYIKAESVSVGTQFWLEVAENTNLSSRETNIEFLVDEVTYYFNLIQDGWIVLNPIWKETSITVPTTETFDFTIGDYSGRAYAKPDATSIVVDLNDICSNSLESSIEFNEGLYIQPDYSKQFIFTGGGVNGSVWFYNSWAYKDITSNCINDPIDDTVADGQYILDSYINTSSEDITVDGITVPAYKGVVNITKAVGDCTFDYVLYYCNSYGGWDSLALKGTATKTDNLESFTYLNKLNIKYLNRITASWELNTGYSCNGEKMYNLIDSTQVYLHNLKEDTIIPVVVTDTSVKYLTYSNNGKKPYYFTINVEESQLKYRK